LDIIFLEEHNITLIISGFNIVLFLI